MYGIEITFSVMHAAFKYLQRKERRQKKKFSFQPNIKLLSFSRLFLRNDANSLFKIQYNLLKPEITFQEKY